MFYLQNPDLEPFRVGYNQEAPPPARAQPARNRNENQDQIDFDGIGSFDMAKTLAEYGINTSVSQYYTVEEWREFANLYRGHLKYCSIACTPDIGEFEHLCNVLAAVPELKMISVPYTNKFSKHDFVMFVRKVKAAFKNHSIMAGNVIYQEAPKKTETKTYSTGQKEAGAIIVNIPAHEMEIPVANEETINFSQGKYDVLIQL